METRTRVAAARTIELTLISRPWWFKVAVLPFQFLVEVFTQGLWVTEGRCRIVVRDRRGGTVLHVTGWLWNAGATLAAMEDDLRRLTRDQFLEMWVPR